MEEYIKLFQNHTQYEAYKNSADYVTPNVSYCEQQDEVHYNPIPPKNVIIYKAPSKLEESTSLKNSGYLHINNFSGSSNWTQNDYLTMVSHEFKNGEGIITFEDDIVSIGPYAFFGCNTITEIKLPDSVTNFYNDAFYNCSGLVNIIIGNSVTTLGMRAFQNCSSLVSIILPNTLVNTNSETFKSCTSLTSINIPNSVSEIGSAIFSGCTSLTSIDIPNSVTSIGLSAFFDCSGLTSVTIEAIDPPTLEENSYNMGNTFPGSYPIYVPSTSVEVYKANNSWSIYASRIQAIP